MPGGEGKVEVAISVISPISRSRLALKGGKGGITQRERERERERSHHGQRELENKNHDKLNVSIVQVQKLVFIDNLSYL